MGTMYFGTWVDHEGGIFRHRISRTALKICPFQGGGCYLLLGTVGVDYHFHVYRQQMAKIPFVDPRYSILTTDNIK
jgi:DNA polymerase-3 subunit alpha/error-prone DNA polymerase